MMMKYESDIELGTRNKPDYCSVNNYKIQDEPLIGDTFVDPSESSSTKNNSSNIPSNPLSNADAAALLDMIRMNSMNHSDYHSHNYYRFKNTLYYYRVPIIVFSACNAFIASATHSYLKPQVITAVITSISLLCGIITGLEMFMNIQSNMEQEFRSHKKYYALAVDILHFLVVRRRLPDADLIAFAGQKCTEFLRICNTSSVIDVEFEDILSPSQPIVDPAFNNTFSLDNKFKNKLDHIYEKESSKSVNKLFSVWGPKQNRQKNNRQKLSQTRHSMKHYIEEVKSRHSFVKTEEENRHDKKKERTPSNYKNPDHIEDQEDNRKKTSYPSTSHTNRGPSRHRSRSKTNEKKQLIIEHDKLKQTIKPIATDVIYKNENIEEKEDDKEDKKDENNLGSFSNSLPIAQSPETNNTKYEINSNSSEEEKEDL